MRAATRTLELPDARIVYDVRGPIPTTDGRPLLLMIGQPMEAGGFTALASYFGDRVVAFTPDPQTLRATRTRIVVAAGEESARQVTGRCAAAVATRLGVPLAIFPSHHGGFLDAASGWGGQPEAFAGELREVLAV